MYFFVGPLVLTAGVVALVAYMTKDKPEVRASLKATAADIASRLVSLFVQK